MSSISSKIPGLALAALLTGVAFGASAAVAGECPADKVVANGQGAQPGPSMPKGVSDTLIGAIPLKREIAGLEDRKLRLRELVIEPGGVVPWHTHTDRPAIIRVNQGVVVEYRSTCAVPIVHATGDVAVETAGLSHWWKNEGKQTAVLTSSDIFHEAADDAHVM
jgi:quercetin dioxygenase-like cupin family protein